MATWKIAKIWLLTGGFFLGPFRDRTTSNENSYYKSVWKVLLLV